MTVSISLATFSTVGEGSWGSTCLFLICDSGCSFAKVFGCSFLEVDIVLYVAVIKRKRKRKSSDGEFLQFSAIQFKQCMRWRDCYPKLLNKKKKFSGFYSSSIFNLYHNSMIIPVRCFSCGKVIGNKWDNYLSLLQADYTEGYVES